LRQAGIPIVETGGLDGTPVDMLVSYFNKEATRDLCEGCRRCMKVCQFGAIGFSAATRKTAIDPRRCYGCGICRAVCKTNAITLRDRRQSPLAARLW
jgi:heterodisulfide reductase subunit A-like polyferredoxin